MSVSESQVYQFFQYQGKKLRYIDEKGEWRTRVLKTIIFDPITKQHVACFQYTGFWKRTFLDIKRVPLYNVELPKPDQEHPEMGRRRSNQGNNNAPIGQQTRRQTRNTFQYYGNFYQVTSYDNFKSGDEVVWTTKSSRDEAYIGKVVVTAEKETVMGEMDTVAIVSLDRIPTCSNGGKPHGYFEYLEGNKQTFVIPMDQLLKLEEWVTVMSAKEANDDGGEWSTVERRNTRKGKQRPKTEYYENYDRSPLPHTSRTKNAGYGHRINSSENVSVGPYTKKEPLQRPKSMHALHTTGSSDEEDFSKGETSWEIEIDCSNFLKTVKRVDRNEVGIQGNNNSCYIDASLFALFSFTNCLDQFILNDSHSCDQSKSSNQVKKILRNYIIFPMRQGKYYVPCKNIEKLRKIFGKAINKEYLSRYMDVEEFLTDLFKLIQTPAFLNYENNEGDHMHQIALPFTWEKSEYTPFLSLSTLLKCSFETFEVTLAEVPEILIIKLPVSEGVLIPCSGVIPELSLQLTDILGHDKKKGVTFMALHAVICLRQNHFVAFVRTGREFNSPWVFMDSKPTIQRPYVCILPDVDQNIMNALDALENEPLMIDTFDTKCEKYSLFRHAYICIYVK